MSWSLSVWAGTEGDIEKGVRGLILYQCDDSKLADALFFVKNDSVRFYDKVPGFSCSVVVWTEPADGLKMLGMG